MIQAGQKKHLNGQGATKVVVYCPGPRANALGQVNFHLYLSEGLVYVRKFCENRYNRTLLSCIRKSGSLKELSKGQVGLKIFVTR